MDVRAIREALAEVFISEEFHTYSLLPEAGDLPLAAVSWPDRVNPHTTLTGGGTLDIVVTLAFSMADFDEAQRRVDEVMSTPGWVEALDLAESDAWTDASVIEISNVRQVNVGASALAVDLVIEVMA
jgi:hypothetical protein